MGKIDDGTFKDWNNGEVMDESDYEQEREILKTAINDNYDRIQNRYTKSETDALISDSGDGTALSIRKVTELPTDANEGDIFHNTTDYKTYMYTDGAFKEISNDGVESDVSTNTTNISNIQTQVDDHESDTTNPHSVSAAQINAVPTTEKGSADGVATLDSNGDVPASQLDNVPKTEHPIYSKTLYHNNYSDEYLEDVFDANSNYFVLITTTDKVICLDASDFSEVWTVQLSYAVRSIVISSSYVFIGHSDGVRRLTLSSGSSLDIVTATDVAHFVGSDTNGDIYVVDTSPSADELYKYDVDGNLLWGPITPSSTFLREGVSVRASNGYVYVVDGDEVVYKLDPADGSTVWSSSFGHTQIVSQTPFYDNGFVYLANNDGYFQVFDDTDGTTQYGSPDRYLILGNTASYNNNIVKGDNCLITPVGYASSRSYTITAFNHNSDNSIDILFQVQFPLKVDKVLYINNEYYFITPRFLGKLEKA